jgi:hypothetical protein
MSALSSLSGTTTGPIAAPAPAKPRARGFLHIVRHGVGPGSIYVLTYHRLESTTAGSTNEHHGNGYNIVGHRSNGNGLSAADPDQAAGVILSVANDPSAIDSVAAAPSRESEPESRPKPILAEGAQALIDLLERIGVDFHRPEVRGALEDILRLGSANIPDLWLSDEDLLAKGLAES